MWNQSCSEGPSLLPRAALQVSPAHLALEILEQLYGTAEGHRGNGSWDEQVLAVMEVEGSRFYQPCLTFLLLF